MNRIKHIIIFGFALFLSNYAYTHEYNPVANQDAVVKSGNVRFTVLTSGLIRMEWAEDGVFEDRASLVFVNRNLPVPEFKKQKKGKWLQIKTNKFTLKYKIDSGRFTDKNLRIEFDDDGTQKQWKPGNENKNNLLGTIRTLDGFDGTIMKWSTKKPIALESGILSRDGWVLIDDTEKPLFDNSDWPWVVARPEKDRQDLYFFCYGSDYKTALKDFTSVTGKIALPPKFAFGTWWSRYWEYTDLELRELVAEFEIHDVPLDVLVVDMDWHITSKPGWYKDGKKIHDQSGEGIGWTGFTWNRNYFPDPKKFLQWTEEKGLEVCLNLHPASGIQPHEEKYPEMSKAMGIDPESKRYVPFDIVNKDFAENFMSNVLHPMEADGVDFWWLDWQQWSTTNIPGVNPTFYLNYVFFSDMERRNEKRPLIFHRYGGLGNHRYQIGFSGDAFINWKSLAYQPYFTATASNVGFGFWSHDIGGHMAGESTPELYTRWIQFGAFSPILRTHCTKAGYQGGIERRIWAYPLEYFYAMRDAFQFRKALLPYIYSAAREAYDTGISICRPMYYDHPKAEEAYNFKNQYMFGNDMLVSPVTQPIGKDSLFIQKEIWLPEGEWIELFSGTILKGGKVVSRTFMLDEIPV
ncbi:MAG: alpha-glucosidase, partial [Candidatus Marinimicrobia bacterium]|nr:alpha-glucosidase [Candidatus Neomarinimicrobiota bacterium]